MILPKDGRMRNRLFLKKRINCPDINVWNSFKECFQRVIKNSSTTTASLRKLQQELRFNSLVAMEMTAEAFIIKYVNVQDRWLSLKVVKREEEEKLSIV